MKVKFKKLHPDAILPSYSKTGDAGMDLTAINHGDIVLCDHTAYLNYRTGLAVEIPEGYVGLIFPRSSVSNLPVWLANSVGVIDSGYRGEIQFRFKLDSDAPFNSGYKAGDRIGQLIILPYPTIEPEWSDELSDTARGEGGFGSTGK